MDDVIILGGAGFIAQHLARRLAADGASQITLADIVRPSYAFRATSVRFVDCDVREPISLHATADTVVFNLAAVHRTPGHQDHEYFATNAAGAENVVDFCERTGVRRLFFTSSIAVYAPSEAPTTEHTPPQPTTAYGQSKLEAEQTYKAWAARQPRRRLVITRPGTVFGPGEGGNFTRLARALAKRRFVYPGRRDTVKACGYVEDLIGSMAFVEPMADPSITYNFGLADPPTIEEVCSAFCTVAGYPQPRVVAPTPLLMTAARTLNRFGASDFNPERVVKLIRSTHIVPQTLIEQGYPYKFDLETAIADWYARSPRGEFI